MTGKEDVNRLCSLCKELFIGTWVPRTPSEPLAKSRRNADHEEDCDVVEVKNNNQNNTTDVEIFNDREFEGAGGDEYDQSDHHGEVENGDSNDEDDDDDDDDNDADDDDENSDDDDFFYEKPDWAKIGTSGNKYCPTHHSYWDLKASATDKCHLCSILWTLAESQASIVASTYKDFETALSQARGIAVVRPGSMKEGSDHDYILEIAYFRHGLHDSRKAYPFGIDVDLRELHESMQCPAKPQDSSITIPAVTVTRIQKWIAECSSSHEACRNRTNATRMLPTRLLDLGAPKEPAAVSLCETIGLPMSTSYMTLSHRRGDGSMSLRLLQDRYNDFRESIPLSDIPKTFLDAITATRAMQIRYLWIDALCIVQDSREDWLREASKMRLVYSNSYVNIAATCAQDSSGGLFLERNVLQAAPCVIDASWTGHTHGTYFTVPNSDWTRFVDQSALSNRAWVFQERLLAIRTLHFAENQLYWDCAEVAASEVYPGGLPSKRLEASMDHSTQSFVNLTSSGVVAADEEDLSIMNDGWLSVVQGYTHRDLTRDGDKLIAVGGVARSIQDRMGVSDENYLAGFWRHALSSSLLWRLSAEGKRYETYIAPSWSWASVKGEVLFSPLSMRSDLDCEFLIDILDAAITLEGDDPFGSVTMGYIKIRGPLYRIWLSEPDLTVPGWPALRRLQIGEFSREGENEFSESLDDEDLYRSWPPDGKFLHYLRIMTASQRDPVEFADIARAQFSEGLILAPVEQTPPGHYARIGWMRIFDSLAGEEFSNSLEEDAPEDGEYSSTEGRQRYTIKLL